MGVYRQRPLLMALVVIFLITTFTYYTGYSIQPADTLEPIERPKVPVKPSDLAVTLNQVRQDPPTIQVIVENKHPHSFITIMLWDSPLDFLALPLGLFQIKPEGSDKPLKTNKTEIKRRYPPNRDLLLSLPPGNRRAQDIVLEPPWVPLAELRERGKTATIQMKGRWKAIWKGTVENVTEESLRSIEVNRGGMMGRYQSDELEIDLWETEFQELEGDWQEEPLLEGPPPEKPPPEEAPLEGELPPEDERPEEERPVKERPPEKDSDDQEEPGKVHGDPGREEDKDDSKDDSKDDGDTNGKEEEKEDKEEDKEENKDEDKDEDEDEDKEDEKTKGDNDDKEKDKEPDEKGRDDDKADKEESKYGKDDMDKDSKRGDKSGKKDEGDEKDDE